eukprot:INCI586.1.p1 GENE.INCI586.1~~INCI586.1.p1  ORF type:complete len:400 (+),score=24.96 INCI586.1:185-1384(+)
MSGSTNLTDLIEQLTDLKTTCSVCLSAAISLLIPVVVTSWVSQEKKDTPSRITNGFLVSVILMSATVLFGCVVDYRIPNPDNKQLAAFTHITLMSKGWCKTQAIAYQFFIWNVMGFWIAVVMSLHYVVSKKPSPRSTVTQQHTPRQSGKITCVEWKVYAAIYGTSTLFVVVPLVMEQFLPFNNQTGDQLQILTADNTLLWCWLASSGGGGILPNDNIPWSQFVFFYGWMIIIFIFSVVFSVKILCRLCAMRRNRHFVAVDSSNVISDYIWRHGMFLALFVLVLAAALLFFANETMSTIDDKVESFAALKVHIIVVCGLGIWCFLVFGTHCIRCGPIGGDAGCGCFRCKKAPRSSSPSWRVGNGSARLSEQLLDNDFGVRYDGDDESPESSVIDSYHHRR